MTQSFRIARMLLCCLVMAALAGCATMQATRLLYNHADWVISRQLDDYFHLTRSQKAFVSHRLGLILDRHRREALPRYEDLLRQVEARVQQGLTPEDLDWGFTQYEQLRRDLFSRFVPDGTDFVHLVEEPQIPRVQKALAGRLEKKEQVLHEPADSRVTRRTERILALAKEWLGALTRQQEEEVTSLTRTFPDTLPAFYAHQRKRDEQLIALLESRRNGDTKARLHDWLVEQENDDNPAFTEVSTQLKQRIGELILALDRLATPTQRTHVLAKLDEYARTVHQLRRA